jgi:hypothetical protein
MTECQELLREAFIALVHGMTKHPDAQRDADRTVTAIVDYLLRMPDATAEHSDEPS